MEGINRAKPKVSCLALATCLWGAECIQHVLWYHLRLSVCVYVFERAGG